MIWTMDNGTWLEMVAFHPIGHLEKGSEA